MQEEMSSPSNVSPPRSATLAAQVQAPITPTKHSAATVSPSPAKDVKRASPAKEQNVPVTPAKVNAENVALPETPAVLGTPGQVEIVTPKKAVETEVSLPLSQRPQRPQTSWDEQWEMMS